MGALHKDLQTKEVEKQKLEGEKKEAFTKITSLQMLMDTLKKKQAAE